MRSDFAVVYRKSSIGITRSLTVETEWNEEALARRADELARRALERWPWHEQPALAHTPERPSTKLRWRIEGGPWQTENAASQMVLNVAATLLSLDPANAQRLSGEAMRSNVHLASRYPPDTAAGSYTMRAVPGATRRWKLNNKESHYHRPKYSCLLGLQTSTVPLDVRVWRVRIRDLPPSSGPSHQRVFAFDHEAQ